MQAPSASSQITLKVSAIAFRCRGVVRNQTVLLIALPPSPSPSLKAMVNRKAMAGQAAAARGGNRFITHFRIGFL